MKRKVLSIFLAALMLLSLFPAAAATSSGGFTEYDSIDRVVGTYQYGVASYNDDMRLSYGYYVPSGGVTVLLFFNAYDNTSANLFTSIAASTWITDPRINVVAIESGGAEYDLVNMFINTYAGRMRNYFQVYYDNTDLIYEYASSIGTSTGMPFALLVTESAGYRYINYYGNYISSASAFTTPLTKLLNGDFGDDYNRPSNTVNLSVAGTEDWNMAYSIYDLTNRQRNVYGQSSLALSASLSEAAMQRAAELAVYYDSTHTRPNGLPYYTAVNGYFSDLSENIDYDTTFYDANAFLTTWMNSTADRANILSAGYNQVGIGVFRAEDRVFAVQLFGTGNSATTYPSYTAKNAVRTVETVPYNVDFSMTGDRNVILPITGTGKLVFDITNAYTRTLTRVVPKYTNDYSVVDVTVDETGAIVLTGLRTGECDLTFRAYNSQSTGITVHVIVRSRNLDGTCGEDATYIQDYANGTLTVSGNGPMTNYTTSKLPDWDKNSIKSAVVRSNITHVGDRAFANAANLTAVTLPDTLVSIGTGAFYGTAITSVTIPASVVSIGDNAFVSCPNLKDIYYGGTQAMWNQICKDITDFSGIRLHYGTGSFPMYGTLGSKVLNWSYRQESGTLVILGSGKSWPGNAPQPFDVFNNNIRTLTLQTGVEELQTGILNGLTNLEKVTLAASVTSIDLPHTEHMKELRLEGGATQWASLKSKISLPDGCNVVLVNRDGSIQTESAGERMSYSEVRDASGKLQSLDITLHSKADTLAVTLPAGITAGVSVRILNDNIQPVEVTVPVTNPTPGMVVTYIDPSGQTAIVRDCAVKDNGLVFTIKGGTYETISIADYTRSFTDAQDWSKGAVEFVVARNLFTDASGTAFGGKDIMTRGMVVTTLYHLANEPHVDTTTGEVNFSDVSPEDFWYEPAVWAATNGVMVGYDTGTFGGEEGLQRQQLAVVLYQYAKWMGCDVSSTTSLASFTDAGSVGSWAKPAMEWAVSIGLINGMGNNILAPTNTATRAEVAAMVKNYCSVVLHKDIAQ